MNNVAKKISKLLNLATSSNENEAKAAAAMAQSLMVKHNLKMSEIEVKEYEESTIDEFGRESVRTKYCRSIIDQYFFVNVVTHRTWENRKWVSRLKIYGASENVEVATYIYSFLDKAFLRLWKQYKAETGCPASSKQSFMFGLYKGICSQLKDTRKKVENETGLVVVPDAGLRKWQDELIGKTQQRRSNPVNTRDSEAREAGREQGKALNISRGISSSSSSRQYALT